MTQTEQIETYRYRTPLMVLGIILAVGLAPLLLYRFFYGQVAAVTPTEAKKLLRMCNISSILIDTSSSDEFDSIHIDGAQSWPLAEIFAIDSRDEVPQQFRDKTLLLICNVGIANTSAAKHLIGIGLEKVMNVRGGTQEWIASVAKPKGDVFDRWIKESGEIVEFPFRQSPWHEQLLIVIGAFPVKISYTILSLGLAIILWPSKSPELAALRWSMIFFFLGENCCAINYYVFNNQSYLFEYLHGFGMLLSFSFVTYALLEGTDRRLLMLSEPQHRCAALGLCKRCIKYENVPCNLRRTFLVIIPAFIIIAFMPLCADWHNDSYNTMIFGTFFNYSHRIVYQMFEKVYCSVAAIVLLAISLLILMFKKNNPLPPAKIFFAAGAGPLGFGLFRTILVSIYRQNMVWFNFWEETTELLFIAGVCFVLWVFRRGLFKEGQCVSRNEVSDN
jgi:rhodanese-related sulfurtransferase